MHEPSSAILDLYMPSFDNLGNAFNGETRQHRQVREEVRQAVGEGAALRADTAYLRAREEELWPDLKKQTRLEIDEKLAQHKLEIAKTGLSRIRTKHALHAQVIVAEARAAEITNGPASPTPAEIDSNEEEAARRAVDALEAAHRGIIDDLQKCRERIRVRDGELRRRFGIAETAE